jgi:hypothetical protein
MGRIQLVVLIMPVITTTLKYPAAVGEARMLQPPHDGASPGVALLRPGSSLLWLSSAEVEAMPKEDFRYRTNGLNLY